MAIINGEVTRDVVTDDWVPFLAAFTQENRGAHAVLEVLGGDVGRQIVTEDRPFEGISADTKGGEKSVWIAFGAEIGDHYTHGIHNVTAIRVRPASGDSGAAVEVETRGGANTLLTLTRAEDYALPSAGSEKNPPSA